MMNQEKLKGHLLILAANILFAINMPVSKYLLPEHVQPEALTSMRMSFACVMFWITSLFVPYEKVPLKDLGLLCLCALCGVGLNQGLFIWGLNTTSPVDASIIATAVPIFVMILAALILKEPITRMKTFGVLLGICGAISLILQSTQGSNQASSLGGNLLITVSGFMYSIYLVVSKPLTLKYSSVTMMKWMFLFAAVAAVAIYYRPLAEVDYAALAPRTWAGIGYVVVCSTFLSYFMVPVGQRYLRPTVVSMYNYVQPLVAVLFTVAVGLDTFGFTKGVAALCVFAGVWLVTKSKSRAQLDAERAAAEQAPENRPRA